MGIKVPTTVGDAVGSEVGLADCSVGLLVVPLTVGTPVGTSVASREGASVGATEGAPQRGTLLCEVHSACPLRHAAGTARHGAEPARVNRLPSSLSSVMSVRRANAVGGSSPIRPWSARSSLTMRSPWHVTLGQEHGASHVHAGGICAASARAHHEPMSDSE